MKKPRRAPTYGFSPDLRERVRIFAEQWTRSLQIEGDLNPSIAFSRAKTRIYAGFLTRFWQNRGMTGEVIPLQNEITPTALESDLSSTAELREWGEAFPGLDAVETLGYLFEFLRGLVVVECCGGEIELKQKFEETTRAETGFVFTPYEICKSMAENILGYFEEGFKRSRSIPIVLDPACGGGAFLIAIARSLAARFPDTTIEEIINQCIFGVDIDPEAALVTRWSLWCLAGNPELGPETFANNVAVGNAILPPATPSNLNPIAWDSQFPFAMQAGGFDIVIGNPPYVRQEKIRQFKPYLQKYQSYSATADLYIYFYELGVNLLKEGGILSLITSNSFLRTRSARPLRGFLSVNTRILDFFDTFPEPVFEASVTPCILTAQKAAPGGNVRVNEQLSTPQTCLSDGPWSFLPADYFALLAKLQESGIPLGDLCDVYFCIKPGRVSDLVLSPDRIVQLNLEGDLFQPVLRGTDIKQYAYPVPSMQIFFPYVEGTFERIEFPAIEAQYPRLAAYLRERRAALEARDDYRRNQDRMAWYELRPCNYYAAFREPKVVTPDICSHNSFTVDAGGYLCLDTIFMIRPKDRKMSVEFLAGYLNSSVVEFFLKMTSSSLGVKGFRYKKQFLENVPLLIDPNLMASVTRWAKKNLRDGYARHQPEINQQICDVLGINAEEREILDRLVNK